MQKIQEEFKRAKRYQTPLAILMLDADNLKIINDTYGHAAGDQALRHVAKLFSDNLRECDFPGRIGGDEFGIILPNTGLQHGKQLAERLKQIIEQQSVEINGDKFLVTMSIGLTVVFAADNTIDDLLRRADKALYQAKSAGGNMVFELSAL